MEIPPPKPNATISVRDSNCMPNNIYLVPYKPESTRFRVARASARATLPTRPSLTVGLLTLRKRCARTFEKLTRRPESIPIHRERRTSSFILALAPAARVQPRHVGVAASDVTYTKHFHPLLHRIVDLREKQLRQR